MVAEINLLPSKNKKILSGKVYIIIVGIVFIIIALFLTYLLLSSKQERMLVESKQNQVQAEVITLQSEVAATTSNETGSRQSAVDFTEMVSYPVSPIILEVGTYLPRHSYLRNYEFSEQTVKFQADFEDKTMIAQFISDLLTSPLFADVKVDEITSFQVGNGTTVDELEDFDEVPRYSASFTLDINVSYVSSMEVTK
ncbi:hypothetical protein FITA111629_04030 [Filibacter tadaridae]|uniref:Fimbrial assembly protein (PilN) n=1 Tax=Filibacter tadaridae TaxID=2483811 RepID=A0A3P5XU15_9BACL|nr:hypothetical protein [Filibacter tadaridae]VDC32622.1 hypothetical protein FILTAD_02824 [Filibacter tadaridae]